MWLLVFSAKARAKSWTDNFISSCGLKALKVITNIVAPRKLESMTFTDIYDKIGEYLKPKKKLVIAERTKFYSMRQGADIGVTQFVAQLRNAAKDCEFEKLKDNGVDPQEEMVKIALLTGLKNFEVQQRVLEKLQSEEMALDGIVAFIQQIEQVHTFMGRRKEILNLDVHAVMKSSGRENSTIICYNCQEQGHISRFCTRRCQKCAKGEVCARHRVKNSKDYRKQTHFVRNHDKSNQNEEGADYKDVFSLESRYNDQRSADQMVKVSIQLGKIFKTISMQEDTGSDSTIISDAMWMEVGNPKLARYTGKQLSMYDNSNLNVIGVFNTVIGYQDKYFPVAIKVVKSSKLFGLLGRDVLNNLKELVNAIIEPQEQLLPAIKDVKVTIGVKPDAVPVFSKAREPSIPLLAEVGAEIDQMLKNGIITEVIGGSRWASPVVMIPKKN